MKKIYQNADKGLEPVISKKELKKGLSEKVSKLIDNASKKIDSNSENRPYDLSSAGPYPDY